MTDTVTALAARRAELVRRKAALKADLEKKIKEADDLIRQLDDAMAVIEQAVAPYKCKACGGSGSIRRCDAAGQMEDWPCPDCRGTGIARIPKPEETE